MIQKEGEFISSVTIEPAYSVRVSKSSTEYDTWEWFTTANTRHIELCELLKRFQSCIPVLGIKKITKLFFLHRTKEKKTLLCKMNFYSFYPLSFPFFSFLCIKVTRETFNDVITRTWRPFRIVIRFFTIKDRSDVRSSGSSSPDTIATLPLSSCSAIIHARDLKDSLKDQRSSHFFHCVWFWKKRRIKSIDSFEYEILWYSVKIWRLKKKKKSKTNPTRKTGREKFRTAFRFLFLFFF